MMEKRDKSYLLEKIKSIILSAEPSAKIYLYGSQAMGTAHSDSDWDLLILLNKKKITPSLESQITSPLYDLEFDSGEIISPMIYSESEWDSKYKVTPFYQNVMNHGYQL